MLTMAIGKVGAEENHFLELMPALSIRTGMALAWLPRRAAIRQASLFLVLLCQLVSDPRLRSQAPRLAVKRLASTARA